MPLSFERPVSNVEKKPYTLCAVQFVVTLCVSVAVNISVRLVLDTRTVDCTTSLAFNDNNNIYYLVTCEQTIQYNTCKLIYVRSTYVRMA